MKFYDNRKHEHDTAIGAACSSVINTIGGFLERQIPGLNLFDNEEEIVDAEFTEIDDDFYDDYDDDFFDTEDPEPETVNEEVVGEMDAAALNQDIPTVGDVIDNYGTHFEINEAETAIKVFNTQNEVVDEIPITQEMKEGYLTSTVEEYLGKLKTKDSLDSLQSCLDQVMYRSEYKG